MSVLIITILLIIMVYKCGKEIFILRKNYKKGVFLYGERVHSLQHILIITYKVLIGIGLYYMYVDHIFHYSDTNPHHLYLLYSLLVFYYIGTITLFVNHLEDERLIHNK